MHGDGCSPNEGGLFFLRPSSPRPPFHGLLGHKREGTELDGASATNTGKREDPHAGVRGGGVCGNRKVLFQGYFEHPRTEETLQTVPPESQASLKAPQRGGRAMFHETGQPRSLSTNPITQAYKCARVGRSPNGGGFFFLTALRLLDPPFHGLLGHNRESIQPDGAPVARQGTGSATTNSGAGT